MFNKTETLQLKGIAVLIMVYYHSVALNPSVLALPTLHAFASRTGNVCVAIFAFITIYGLTKKLLSTSDPITIKGYPLFVIKRTAALYRSFWPAYLLAFAVSAVSQLLYYIVRIPDFALLSNNYGAMPEALLHGIINFFGLSHAFYGNNLYTLNQTWWYMSLALVLVLLVPLYALFCQQHAAAALAGSFLLAVMVPTSAWRYVQYLPLLAIASAKAAQPYRHPGKFQYLLFGGAVLLWAAVRLISPTNHNDLADSLVAWPMIELLLLVLRHAKPWLQRGLSFIGLHSANIFYLHSFIYHYWPTSYLVNFFRVGFLEFAATVLLTILLSQMLEHWKAVLGWDACLGRIFSVLF